MNYKTTSGITVFRDKESITAYTKTRHGELEVHMRSGTIFTVCKEESDKFIRWVEMEWMLWKKRITT